MSDIMRSIWKQMALLLLFMSALCLHNTYWPNKEPRTNSLNKEPFKNCPEDNKDCVEFERLLQNWPKDKPKAAIYLLAQRLRVFTLKRVLKSLDAYFNDKYKYPVIIFHEKDFIPLLPQLKKSCKSMLFFQKLNFTLPDFLSRDVPQKLICDGKHSIGYRHMCRFHAKMIYKEPIIQRLEYYWRLDDDSFLLRHVNYDVFKFMREHDLDYGYSLMNNDSKTCTVGLWDAAKEYIKNKQIKTQFFNQWPENRMFYNNFEIGKISIWKSQQYTEYIDYIDKQGGIYYHRWGDATIKGIAIAMFVPKNKIHDFKDIGYKHDWYKNP